MADGPHSFNLFIPFLLGKT